MSSNPQPEQEWKERMRDGGGVEVLVMFNVASLCGLTSTSYLSALKVKGLVEQSAVSMDQDCLWFH